MRPSTCVRPGCDEAKASRRTKARQLSKQEDQLSNKSGRRDIGPASVVPGKLDGHHILELSSESRDSRCENVRTPPSQLQTFGYRPLRISESEKFHTAQTCTTSRKRSPKTGLPEIWSNLLGNVAAPRRAASINQRRRSKISRISTFRWRFSRKHLGVIGFVLHWNHSASTGAEFGEADPPAAVDTRALHGGVSR